MNEEQSMEKRGEQGGALPTEAVGSDVTFVPQVDIIEKQDGLVVLADMPGVAREDVEAIIEEGVLTISGKVTACGGGNLTPLSAEYESGNFQRSFTVGEGLDTEGVEASMKDGVLQLVIPKSQQYRPRQIEIH